MSHSAAVSAQRLESLVGFAENGNRAPLYRRCDSRVAGQRDTDGFVENQQRKRERIARSLYLPMAFESLAPVGARVVGVS